MQALTGLSGLSALVGGGFSPLSLSPKLWLRADQGLFQDSAGTTPATADADPLGRWSDLSGNGNHATETTSSKRPTLKKAIVNGKDVVRPDGVDDGFSLPLSLVSGSWTLCASLSGETTGTKYLLDALTGRLIFCPGQNTGVTKVGWFDGTARIIADQVAGFQVLTWVLTSGGNGEIFRNGTSLGTAAYAAKAIGGTVALLCTNDLTGAFMTKDVREVVLFNRALTVVEQHQMTVYQGADLGVAVV